MNEEQKHTPLTSYFFIFLLIVGGVMLVISLFTAEEGTYFGSFRQLAAGVTLVGIGEWINHPLQKSLTVADRHNFIFQRIRHRQRNPNGIGNILEIIGLLLIFAGLAKYV